MREQVSMGAEPCKTGPLQSVAVAEKAVMGSVAIPTAPNTLSDSDVRVA